jgi:hypothetical protein
MGVQSVKRSPHFHKICSSWNIRMADADPCSPSNNVQAYWHRPSSPAKGLFMTVMLQIWTQIRAPSGIVTC